MALTIAIWVMAVLFVFVGVGFLVVAVERIHLHISSKQQYKEYLKLKAEEKAEKEAREKIGVLKIEIRNVYSAAEGKLLATAIEREIEKQNYCKQENSRIYMVQKFDYIEKALLQKEGEIISE